MRSLLRMIVPCLFICTVLLGGTSHAKSFYVFYGAKTCAEQCSEDFGPMACVVIFSRIFKKEEYKVHVALPENTLLQFAHDNYSGCFPYYGDYNGYPRWFNNDKGTNFLQVYNTLEEAEIALAAQKESYAANKMTPNKYFNFTHFKVIEDEKFIPITE